MRRRCSPREVLDAIGQIRPSGFALAASHNFMLTNHVVFAEQKSLVPAWATEILAQPGETLAFVEPGKPTKGNSLSTNL